MQITEEIISDCKQKLSNSFFNNKYEGALEEAIEALRQAKDYWHIGRIHNPYLRQGKRGRNIANLIAEAIRVIRTHFSPEELTPFSVGQTLNVYKGEMTEEAKVEKVEVENERCLIRPTRDRAEAYYISSCALVRWNPRLVYGPDLTSSSTIEEDLNEDGSVKQTDIFDYL